MENFSYRGSRRRSSGCETFGFPRGVGSYSPTAAGKAQFVKILQKMRFLRGENDFPRLGNHSRRLENRSRRLENGSPRLGNHSPLSGNDFLIGAAHLLLSRNRSRRSGNGSRLSKNHLRGVNPPSQILSPVSGGERPFGNQ